MAGCRTIWIVCNDDMQPLIRYRLGDYVYDYAPLKKATVQKGSKFILSRDTDLLCAHPPQTTATSATV